MKEARIHKHPQHRQAFTLIELLVVIAIIAILAAILFPVYATAQEHARQTKCLANLKQLASAMRQYADDNNGRLPSVGWEKIPEKNFCGCGLSVTPGSAGPTTGHWVYPRRGQLWPYVRSAGIFLCPSDVNKPGRYCPAGYPLSYSMNDRLDWAPVDAGRYRRPSKMLLLIHESRGVPGSSDSRGINDSVFVSSVGQNRDLPENVHYTGTTVAYIDGHSRWMSYNNLIAERDAGYWVPVFMPK